jgi:hypothetical protein
MYHRDFLLAIGLEILAFYGCCGTRLCRATDNPNSAGMVHLVPGVSRGALCGFVPNGSKTAAFVIDWRFFAATSSFFLLV